MPTTTLARMVVQNTLRSRKQFVLSAIGIVFGIGAYVFFLALTAKVGVVLERIFPVEQVEVVAPRMGKALNRKINDATVQQILQRPEVKSALPRMSIAFPAFGHGNFEGASLNFELVADGVDPRIAGDDPDLSLFRDWDAEGTRQACVPPPRPTGPDEDRFASPPSPRSPADIAAGKFVNPCPDPERYYCDRGDRTCHHRVPVVVSPALLELYNRQYAKSHNLPIVEKDLAKFIVKIGGLSKMRFVVELGYAGREVEATLVGISDAAMPIGMTMPLPYLKRWNRDFKGAEAAEAYSSVVVTLRDKDQIAVFSQWLKDSLDLRLEDSLGERFATVILIIRVLFLGISILIILISAINISHNFFMQIAERRRELGVMRAVGATPADIRRLILGESAMIGIVGGSLGVLLALAVARTLDWLILHQAPNFPFKPVSWFSFNPTIWLTGIALSTVFCMFGGFWPARKAAAMEPAQALAQG